MIIRIGTPADPAGVELVEPDRFDRFHVETDAGASHAEIDDALQRSSAGSFDVNARLALISADWIRRHDDGGGTWSESFDAMLAYAGSKGWYSSAEGTVQAHVEFHESAGLSADEFRAAFRGHPAGVAVITADDGSGPVGLTATSVFSVSAEPPLLVFSVSHSSSSSPTIRASESVVVHLLWSRDLWIAELCATSGIDRFADTSIWNRLPTGEPYFPAATRWLRATVVATALAGASTIVTVRALETGSGFNYQSGSGLDHDRNDTPLVYHNRTWHALTERSELGVRTS